MFVSLLFNSDYALGFIVVCGDHSQEVITSPNRIAVAYLLFKLYQETKIIV